MNKVKHYEVLFIDLDNTLYDFSGNSDEAYRAVYALMEYDRWFDSYEHYYSIFEEYNLKLWALYAKGEISKEYLNAERYAHPLRVVGVPEAEVLGARFWNEAMQRLPLGNRLMPHAREALEYLRPRYRMYILSNGFAELQARKMKSAGIAHYFDGVVLSEDIGINKPHPAIFEHALRMADVSEEKALMIGDNYEVDIEGALAVGIDQVFYNVGNITLPPGKPMPTYTILSLLELKGLL